MQLPEVRRVHHIYKNLRSTGLPDGRHAHGRSFDALAKTHWPAVTRSRDSKGFVYDRVSSAART